MVDATGRRSPVDDWLAQIGARATATWQAECGMAYFSRHYRVRPAADLPGLLVTRIVVALDEFLAGKWGGDNGAAQLVVAPLAADRRFRTVRDPQVFTAVLRTIPVYAAWLDAMDPITGVFPMAGLHNTLRRLVVDGTPVATGLHAIGDSVCTTNPTLGRGLALALSGAADLVDDRRERRRSRRAGARPGSPRRREGGAVYSGRRAGRRGRGGTLFGAPPPEASSPGPGQLSQLRAAASGTRPPSARSGKSTGCLPPDEVYTDPDVIASTRKRSGGGTAPPAAGPTREQLLTALIATGSDSGSPPSSGP